MRLEDKIARLHETFPFATADDLKLLLQEHDGNIVKVSEAIMNMPRWKKSVATNRKKPTSNQVVTSEAPQPNADDNNNKQYNNNTAAHRGGRSSNNYNQYDNYERPPSNRYVGGRARGERPPSRAVEEVATPALVVKAGGTVVKGGVSFADILKSSKKDEAAVEAPPTATPPQPPPPPPPPPPLQQQEKETVVVVPQPKSSAIKAEQVVEQQSTSKKALENGPTTTPTAATEQGHGGIDGRRNNRLGDRYKKPTTEAEFVPPPPPPQSQATPVEVKPTAPPAPQPPLTYVPEFERISRLFTLPQHVMETSEQSGSKFTFDGTPGKPPTPPPPPPPQVILPAPQQRVPTATGNQAQSNFFNAFLQQSEQPVGWGGQQHPSATRQAWPQSHSSAPFDHRTTAPQRTTHMADDGSLGYQAQQARMDQNQWSSLRQQPPTTQQQQPTMAHLQQQQQPQQQRPQFTTYPQTNATSGYVRPQGLMGHQHHHHQPHPIQQQPPQQQARPPHLDDGANAAYQAIRSDQIHSGGSW